MQGSILIYKPGMRKPEVRNFERALNLDDLKDAIGGGYLEHVPSFDTIEHDGKLHRCHAFCDEHGKLDYRPGKPLPHQPDPPNERATLLWMLALRRRGYIPSDFLVGQIAVIIGDAEFMAEL
jgi:hypothetical protein